MTLKHAQLAQPRANSRKLHSAVRYIKALGTLNDIGISPVKMEQQLSWLSHTLNLNFGAESLKCALKGYKTTIDTNCIKYSLNKTERLSSMCQLTD